MSRPETVRVLLENEDLQAAFASVERGSLEAAIYAPDDASRAMLLGEVRALRSVLGKLALMARDTSGDDATA